MDESETDVEPASVAIVGMDGRFPGASDPAALWARVSNGEDCLDDVSVDELLASGVSRNTALSPGYVRRNGALPDPDGFDPGFFGIGARDAALMDPQHRHFLECAWGALESGGLIPGRFAGSIGIFGGCGANTYMLHNLLTNTRLVEQLGWFLLRHTGNDKDFFTNNVAYRLDLQGPAVNVQTACSTSLVAIHLAVQSLLGFECDLALAGGATIEFPLRRGYEYREGEILSPDGRCRAFDAASGGTVLTSGVGVVALRRLEDAQQDGDPILAVIRASAINNDGTRKVGFLAPSVDGHADVIKEALAVAGLSARDIQLFEAHGTGTAVGDPIEFAAITTAYREFTDDVGFCRLVSTKPNIGHLDTAAGVASIIKVVQALRHQTLPPLANHTAPSPLLDLERSPLYVTDRADEWSDARVRRAGVSSLGVGGTNAHIILEEAPAVAPLAAGRGPHVLALSAKTQLAVADAAERLADHLERHPEIDPADVAHTLVHGRAAFEHRRVVTVSDRDDAIAVLRDSDRRRVASGRASSDGHPDVVFMFPGGGSQYAGMGGGLDDRFGVFHEVRRAGIAAVRELGGPDLTTLLQPGGDEDELRRLTTSLPAVFITSIALARQWLDAGLAPRALLGHSLGEYVAAHLAGVLSLEDALTLVVRRSELMERVSGADAAMLVVPLAEEAVRAELPSSLSLSVVNADDECVVSGRRADIAAYAEVLDTAGTSGRLVPLNAAAHSHLLDPILDDFLDVVEGVQLAAPQIPYVANLTGTWITAEQATSPQYWVDHLRGTVRFADSLRTVLADGPTVLTELGPGQALSSYARRQRPNAPVAAIAALRHPDHDIDDTRFTVQAMAAHWAHGVDFDLDRLLDRDRRRILLPTYPFQHERHWIDPGGPSLVLPSDEASDDGPIPARPHRIEDPDRATWLPSWVDTEGATATGNPGSYTIVADEGDPLATAVIDELRARGGRADRTTTVAGEIDPACSGIIVFAPRDGTAGASERRWLLDGTEAARLLGRRDTPGRLVALTRHAMAVDGPATNPLDAMALGVVAVAPREYGTIRSVLVDVDVDGADVSSVIDDLLAADGVVARRGGRRLVPELVRAPLPDLDELPADGGAYLVTGGLGGVGHVLAAHLARDRHADLVILSSSPLPEPAARDAWLRDHAFDDPTSRRIRQLRGLEEHGTKVAVVVGDAGDADAVRVAVREGVALVGPLTGAIHAAGRVDDRLLELADFEDHLAVTAPKVNAAVALLDELRSSGGELLVLVSSTSTALAPEGQTAYVAANAVLDAMAGVHGGLSVKTVNFGLWSGVGIASAAGRRARLGLRDGAPVSHPVLGEHWRDGRGLHVVGRLDLAHHWVVDEHRTAAGQALLPGTGHLELMIAAAEVAGIEDPRLESVVLLEPLLIEDGRPVTVRVTVGDDQDDDGRRSVAIASDRGAGQAWVQHSEARVSAGRRDEDQAGEDAPTERSDGRAGTAVDPLVRPRRHLQLGEHWDAVIDASCDGGTAQASLALSDRFVGEIGAWRAHPALLDVATALAVALTPEDDASVAVPIGYGLVEVQTPLPARFDLTARLVDHGDDHFSRVDLRGVADGREVLRIDALDLLPVDAASEFVDTVDDVPTGTRVGPLVEMADELGLRPDDGVELFERFLAAPDPRVVISTIDLDELRHRVDEPEPDEQAEPAPLAASLEEMIAGLWRSLLGIDEVGAEDDFFELGGHSLIAIRLMSQIHAQFGVRLPLATIFEAPTITALATRIRSERPDLDEEIANAAAAAEERADTAAAATVASTSTGAPMARHLVTISGTGTKRPLFVVHGAGGGVLFLWSLGRALAGDRPLYAFQAHGTEGDDIPDPSIEAMAARYAAELRDAHPGPYLIGGYSAGGLIALEMVRQLRVLGEDVDYVVLFDSTPGGRAFPDAVTRRTNLVRHVMRGGVRPVVPYLKYVLGNRFPKLMGRPPVERDDEVADDEYLDNVDDLFWYVSRKAEEHPETTYRVDALLLKAEHNWPGLPDDYYWTPYIDGTMDVRVVHGEHHSMFFPENAEHLGRVLAAALDERDRRSAPPRPRQADAGTPG